MSFAQVLEAGRDSEDRSAGGGSDGGGDQAVSRRVQTANTWALLELSSRVVRNLGWRWGTAEREGCGSSAGRLLGAEGGQAMPMTGFQTLPLLLVAGVVVVVSTEIYWAPSRQASERRWGCVVAVDQKAFSSGDPSGVPYFKKSVLPTQLIFIHTIPPTPF